MLQAAACPGAPTRRTAQGFQGILPPPPPPPRPKKPQPCSHIQRPVGLVRAPCLKRCVSIDRRPRQKTREGPNKRISPCHARRREQKSKFANSTPAGRIGRPIPPLSSSDKRRLSVGLKVESTRKCRANPHAPIHLGHIARTAAVRRRWVEVNIPQEQHRNCKPQSLHTNP